MEEIDSQSMFNEHSRINKLTVDKPQSFPEVYDQMPNMLIFQKIQNNYD